MNSDQLPLSLPKSLKQIEHAENYVLFKESSKESSKEQQTILKLSELTINESKNNTQNKSNT